MPSGRGLVVRGDHSGCAAPSRIGGRGSAPEADSICRHHGYPGPQRQSAARGWVALYLTRDGARVAAYLAEERRRDPHSVVKERTLPTSAVAPWKGLP
ncbi:hypothetical protein GCM10010121_054680 [Streptomyces brasiliensis]|uniref:Uncharacterized protein n=1 Tax=Streptomyces brasiliensis TaxID=1954 RepID=A0A917L1X9_9ACTN|nr:hypothetical protein GCM10010121_054680 [Streptomyces brasiliensis]